MEHKRKVKISELKNPQMYNQFINELAPSVCVSGNLDITNVYKQKRKGHSLNALLCYSILQAAQNIEEFHYSIQKDGLYYYDFVKTNAVLIGKDNQHYYADYKYFDNFEDFEKEYERVNKYCIENCTHFSEDTGSMIATSAIVGYPFTSISLGVSTEFWDHFIMWGKYEKHLFKKTLNISLRFHHAIIDGGLAAKFFNELQRQFKILKTKKSK